MDPAHRPAEPLAGVAHVGVREGLSAHAATRSARVGRRPVAARPPAAGHPGHSLPCRRRVRRGASLGVVLGTITGLSRGIHRAWSRRSRPSALCLRSPGDLFFSCGWIDDTPKVLLVAIGAFFPVYVNLVAGIHGVDRQLVEVARVYNLSPAETARRVILPASLPSVFTGLRLGFSQAWLFVVVAEIFGATRGLGFRLTDSQQLTRVDLMLVAMLRPGAPRQAHRHGSRAGGAASAALARHDRQRDADEPPAHARRHRQALRRATRSVERGDRRRRGRDRRGRRPIGLWQEHAAPPHLGPRYRLRGLGPGRRPDRPRSRSSRRRASSRSPACSHG